MWALNKQYKLLIEKQNVFVSSFSNIIVMAKNIKLLHHLQVLTMIESAGSKSDILTAK